jgi:hypothetical protein
MKTNLTNEQITEVLSGTGCGGHIASLRARPLYDALTTTGHLQAIRALRDRGCSFTFISGIFGMSASWSAVAFHRDAKREAKPDFREEAHQATAKLKWLKTTLEEFRTEYTSTIADESGGDVQDVTERLLHKLEDFLQ